MRKYISALLGIGLLISACSQPSPSPTSTQTPTPPEVRRYYTATPSPALPTPTLLSTIPVTPAPTATPYLHTITNDDTMLGIALKYGISLADLMAANPGVNPNFLTVGKTLVIPIKGQDLAVVPTATPVPVKMGETTCYSTLDGLWCFVLVKNDQHFDVENLSAWIGLFSPQGKNLAGQVAIAPLNRLPQGARLPLAAFFPRDQDKPLPAGYTVRSELLTAISVEDGAARYLDAQAQLQPVQISTDGMQAGVSGTLALTGGEARTAWVAAVAYDEGGKVIGVRKWEASSDSNCLQPALTPTPAPQGTPMPTGTPLPVLSPSCLGFDFTVFSLGPAIKDVDVLVEARP